MMSVKEYGRSGIGASMSVCSWIISVKADSMVSRMTSLGMGRPREVMFRSRFVLGMLNMMGRVTVLSDEELACGNRRVVVIRLRFATALAPGVNSTTPYATSPPADGCT